MSLIWQQGIILGAVFVSVLYLGRSLIKVRKRKTGCSACPANKMINNSYKDNLRKKSNFNL